MANEKENVYGEARLIPVAACHPTLDCSRKINEDSPRFRDLLASVEANGIVQPVLVRPAGGGSGISSVGFLRRLGMLRTPICSPRPERA